MPTREYGVAWEQESPGICFRKVQSLVERLSADRWVVGSIRQAGWFDAGTQLEYEGSEECRELCVVVKSRSLSAAASARSVEGVHGSRSTSLAVTWSLHRLRLDLFGWRRPKGARRGRAGAYSGDPPGCTSQREAETVAARGLSLTRVAFR
jgi:hypothetical protein